MVRLRRKQPKVNFMCTDKNCRRNPGSRGMFMNMGVSFQSNLTNLLEAVSTYSSWKPQSASRMNLALAMPNQSKNYSISSQTAVLGGSKPSYRVDRMTKKGPPRRTRRLIVCANCRGASWKSRSKKKKNKKKGDGLYSLDDSVSYDTENEYTPLGYNTAKVYELFKKRSGLLVGNDYDQNVGIDDLLVSANSSDYSGKSIDTTVNSGYLKSA